MTMRMALFMIFVVVCTAQFLQAQTDSTAGYIVRSETTLLQKARAPHGGRGETFGCTFFDDIKDFALSFRKRVLQNGASIGNHQQKRDEIYYIVSGEGTILLDSIPHTVKAGDAILTRTGHWHELRQTSKEDLVVMVVFVKDGFTVSHE